MSRALLLLDVRRVVTLVSPGLLLGCNAVLGIDPPKELELSPTMEYSSLDGGSGARDTPEDYEPSPYAWALWPMPNPASVPGLKNPQKFGVRSPGVMVDTITELQWQRVVSEGPLTRKQAQEYCAELALDGGGFRLPSRIELLSIVDFSRSNPSLDPEAFPDTPLGKYWTASPFVGSPGSNWLVSFEFGTGLAVVDGNAERHLVRCVRDPEPERSSTP